MKKTIYISLLLALIVSVSAHAQKPDVTENFDINGIIVGSEVNDRILSSKLGSPTSVEVVGPGFIIYNYGQSGICVINNDLMSVSVADREFPVMTTIFDEGIKVGDNASKVKAKIQEKTRNEIHETDKGFIVGNYDYHVSFGVSNGKITLISFDLESY